ncbi:MAG TPA: prepilin-type N-terminal cleavage/methylation domain-containing protein [Gemmatimonadaceae bacterium]|nr:prepilin-type N-terminal cleavage/methylation domain-containing protein [Gemmatimonadaceae bacterium]
MLTKKVVRRAGFTLVEMLIGVVVSSIVGAATLALTVHHERLGRALDRILITRRATREASDALRYDLRALAPRRQDIYAIGEAFVEFRLSAGFAVVCAIDSSRTVVSIPARSSSGPSLTSWIVAPEAGDTAMVLLPAANPDSATWSTAQLNSAPSRGRACPPEFADAGDPATSLVLRLTAPLATGAGVGAAMRLFRRARYELYRASDGAWYLGFQDCLATRATPCAIIQPVAGPYPARGIQFRFLDSAAAPTALSSRVTRIDIVVRSTAALGPRIPGLPAVFGDSVLLTITPRD